MATGRHKSSTRRFLYDCTPFGATSSSSCANFGLLQTAKDNSNLYDAEIVKTVKTNFYTNDCLKPVANETEALQLYYFLTDLLKRGGFYSTEWKSNSENVLKQIAEELPHSV